ncbi:unnamed protein product [[Candida] boidinii]|nr:unnamed protein product [[Candida] boidinii]
MKTDESNSKSVGLIDDSEISQGHGQVVTPEDLSTIPQAIEDSNTPVSDLNSVTSLPPLSPVNHSADSTSQVEQDTLAISVQTPSSSSPESNQKISHSSSTSKLFMKRGFNFKRFNRATITSTSIDHADLSGLQSKGDAPQPDSLQSKNTNVNGTSPNSNSASNFKFLYRKQRSSTVSKISTNNIDGHISSSSVSPSSPTNATKRFRNVLNGNSDTSNNPNLGDKNITNGDSSNGSEPISKLIISSPIMTQSTIANHFKSPLLTQQNHQFQQFQQNDTTENPKNNGGPILADLDEYMDDKGKQHSMNRSPKMAQQHYHQQHHHQLQQHQQKQHHFQGSTWTTPTA